MIPTILSVLDGVKKVGTSTWVCRCPAHEDRSPSLRVTMVEDGRVLIHCFAGCGAGDVLAAVGMSMRDLFPRRTGAIADHFSGWHPNMRDRNKEAADHVMLALSNARRTKRQKQSVSDRRAEFEAWKRLKKSDRV